MLIYQRVSMVSMEPMEAIPYNPNGLSTTLWNWIFRERRWMASGLDQDWTMAWAGSYSYKILEIKTHQLNNLSIFTLW